MAFTFENEKRVHGREELAWPSFLWGNTPHFHPSLQNIFEKSWVSQLGNIQGLAGGAGSWLAVSQDRAS